MRKKGILNAELSKVISALGHKDLFMIGDCGMPIPAGVQIIDLVLVQGVPTFEQVLSAILDEVVVEEFTIATELPQQNPGTYQMLKEKIGDVPEVVMSHEELKAFSKACKFAIRTGENSPYANVILRSGVAFS